MSLVCALLHALAARGEREGFPRQAAMVMCYMDLSKLLHGFVKVVTWICQCFLCIAFAAGGERASPARQAAMVM